MMSSSLLVASFPLNKKNSCHGPRCVFGNTTTLTHVSKQQPQQSKHDHNTSFHFQNLAQLRCKQVRKQSCLSVERCFILFVIAALLRHLIYRMPYVSRDLLETDIEELIISRCAWLPRCVLLARCPWLIWFRIQFLWSVRAWHIAGLQKIHDLQKYIREISPARAGADGPCRGYAASESASESVSEFASESAWTPACKSHRWSVGICWRNFTYINVWLRVRIRVRINVGICAWICACMWQHAELQAFWHISCGETCSLSLTVEHFTIHSHGAWLPRCALLARCPWLIWFRIQFLWSVRAWHIAGLQKIHDLQKYIREISPARAGADGPCRGYAASESASESVSEFASESAWTPACKSHRWSVGICWRNFTYINVWLRVRIRVRINVGICAWICACMWQHAELQAFWHISCGETCILSLTVEHFTIHSHGVYAGDIGMTYDATNSFSNKRLTSECTIIW